MKHDWNKSEKVYYKPAAKPQLVNIPTFRFFTLRGKGNPNDDLFAEYIGVLYSLAYAVKMSPKKGLAPEGYFEYTVYPLEGVWDIDDEAKKKYTGTIDKNTLTFNLMIRQPEFVDQAYALQTIQRTVKSKPHLLLEQVRFETIEEGLSVQMLHIGSYDNEPASFKLMEDYCQQNNLARISKIHREIYLSDARRVAPEKLKTILRFAVKEQA